MNAAAACSSCGAPLPASARGSICPKCLLAAGLESAAPGSIAATSAEARPQPASATFLPPPVAELARLFPHLEVLELIGQGGMGAVYKARQPGLDRLVAIKILPPTAGQEAAFAERFAREARALARLSHPNIVAVYDFGRSGDLFYFVMEYVDGANLRQTIRSASLTPAEALAIVPQICDALQYAHDEGVVHRDIKPENILLDRRGRVKIADFGLAKLLGQEHDATLTGTHQVMGTLRYMAPEQMEGAHAVDHRADIYSLGVVFYELLTGDVPVGRFPPPSKKVQVDVRLDEVVLRALEREPEQRFQRASEVKSELQTILSAPPAVDLPPAGRLGPPNGKPLDFAMQLSMRDGSDLAYVAIVSLFVCGVFYLLPLAAAYLVLTFVMADQALAALLSVFIATGFLIGLFAILGLGSISGATVDADGITLHRYAGPSKFLPWNEIRRIQPISSWEVARQVGFWPGLPPRGSIIGMSAKDWYRIDAREGCWYFCPADREGFLRAVGLASPHPAASALAGPASEPTLVAATLAGPVAALPRPWGVPVLATINLLSSVAMMFVIAGDAETWIPATAGRSWWSWEQASNVMGYLISALSLAAAVGMYLWLPWARTLSLAMCWATIGTLITDTPFLARYYLPRMYNEMYHEVHRDNASDEEAAMVAFSIMFVLLGGFFLVGMVVLIFQIWYLSRPHVVAAFEGCSGERSSAFARLLVWLPVVGVLVAGLAVFVLMQTSGERTFPPP